MPSTVIPSSPVSAAQARTQDVISDDWAAPGERHRGPFELVGQTGHDEQLMKIARRAHQLFREPALGRMHLPPEITKTIDRDQKALDFRSHRCRRQVPALFEAVHILPDRTTDDVGKPAEE